MYIKGMDRRRAATPGHFDENRIKAQKLAKFVEKAVNRNYPGLTVKTSYGLSWEKSRPEGVDWEYKVAILLRDKLVYTFHLLFDSEYAPKEMSNEEVIEEISNALAR